MVDSGLFDDVYREQKFSFKIFLRSFVAAGAMAVFLLILIWVLEYFNPAGENFILTHLNLFLIYNWFFIVAFILIISIWDYLYKIFKTSKLRYFAPLFDAFGTFFAIWLIAVLLNALTLFLDPQNIANPFLKFLYDLFYSLPVLLFILILLVYYSKFFLMDRRY